jgi:hypothetical protein|tara:strand:- start:1476 stop:1727 length:252 start_codon:yes stop_codon:yes gene_type:complete
MQIKQFNDIHGDEYLGQTDKVNAKGLIDLALIFARNNMQSFFESDLMKHTTYSEVDMDRLVDNFINNNTATLELLDKEGEPRL